MLIDTKDEIKENLKKIQPMLRLLNAMAYGAEVDFWGHTLAMKDGVIFNKVWINPDSPDERIEYHTGPMERTSILDFIELCAERAEKNPEWAEDLLFEAASRATLNRVK